MRDLDRQLETWSEKLCSELKINEEESRKLATTIAKEVRWLNPEQKKEIKEASPVDLSARYDELIAFQGWMEFANSRKHPPSVIRAQVIVQNYICFVYLNESCFRVLKKFLPNGSAAKKCCNYLINNPIRAFRNAVAHSNWCYNNDFSGLRYWARKGADQNEPLQEFEVSDVDLSFWQTLARCVAYATYENL